MSGQSPSQTVGPFFHIALIRSGENVMVNDDTLGQRILVRGTVLDGDGQPVPDAMLEVWQADAAGIYAHPADPRHAQRDPSFGGFGRAATDDRGRYSFKTIKPGLPRNNGPNAIAPHLNLRVFARGMLIHAYTRVYFSDELLNSNDPVLSRVGDLERRKTLIASLEANQDLPTYRFDIVLQGDHETVFFDP